MTMPSLIHPCDRSSQNLSDRVRFKNRERDGKHVDEEKLSELRKNYRLTVPNPLNTLIVFTDLETVLLLGSAGLALANFYAISTGAAKAFQSVYGFDELKISLMFLPIGGGSLISAFTTGMSIAATQSETGLITGDKVKALSTHSEKRANLLFTPRQAHRLVSVDVH